MFSVFIHMWCTYTDDTYLHDLFTNFSGSGSPVDKYSLSASNLRRKFAASAKASSLDIESGGLSPSPKESPVSQIFIHLFT